MPKLHIIYDPHDKISSNSDMDKQFDLKVATLSLMDDLSDDDIAQYAHKLMLLLLRQLTNGSA